MGQYCHGAGEGDSVTTARVRWRSSTLAWADWKSVRVEAKVCADCAYTEFYAKGLDDFGHLAWQCLGHVQRIDIP